MEKWIIFGPMIGFFAVFALLVGGFLFFIFRLVMKSKNSFWSGQVADKQYRQRRVSDNSNIDRTEDYFSLAVKMDDGQTRNIAVSRLFYDGINVGDRVEKPKGELYPKKVG